LTRKSVPEGGSLLEVVLSLLLLSLLVSAGWSFLAQHREVGQGVSHRAEGLETIRTLAWLLAEETRTSRPGLDWFSALGDSLPLRAFRGLALPDPEGWTANRVRVCFQGHRSPAPEKDSVLLLGPDGSWRALDLVDRVSRSDECVGMSGWGEEEWTLSGGVPGAILGRLYERGSYHLADGALRYRRGSGGRQPLTPENLQEGSFIDPAGRGGGVRWEVVLEGLTGIPGREVDPVLRTWRGGW
jgi:hypothetical protein